MPRRVFSSLGLLAAIAAPALAGGSLVVVDANQVVLGELINVTPGWIDADHHDLMLYRYGSNESMLVRVDRNGLPVLGLYFQTTDCSGQAWVIAALNVYEGHAFATGIAGPDGQMYRVEPGLSYSWRTTHSSILLGTGCQEGDLASGYLPAFPVGPALTYEPPLSYVLSPSEFWDIEQSGD